MLRYSDSELDIYQTLSSISAPILFVIGLILSFFVQNLYEIQFRHTIRTFLVGIIFVLFLFAINNYFFRKKVSGLMVFLQLLLVSTFGIQLEVVSYLLAGESKYTIFQKFGGKFLILNLVPILSFAGIARYRDIDIEQVEQYSKFFCFCFLGIILFSSAPTILSGSETSYNSTVTNELEVGREKPDIYYIVPDKYTGSSILKNQFNHNNSEFTKYLEERGFVVQNSSFANYGASYASLASSLNLGYLQELGIGENSSQRDILALLENNKVQEMLTRNEYKYYHVGSVYTEFNKHADRSYSYLHDYLDQKIYLNRFEKLMAQKSVFYAIRENNPYYSATPMSFKKVSKLSKKEEDKFVFLHVMSPHRPYSLPRSVEDITYYPEENYSERKRYTQELEAVNVLLKRTVNEILKNEDDAIIIIQGDEGPGLINSPNFTRKLTEEENLRREQSIFFAHYTPEIQKDKFRNEVNPTNIFRIVFNERFNSSFDTISKKYYFNVNGGKNVEFYKKPIKIKD